MAFLAANYKKELAEFRKERKKWKEKIWLIYFDASPFFFTTAQSLFVISLGVIAAVPKTSPSVMSATALKDTVYPPNGFFAAIFFLNLFIYLFFSRGFFDKNNFSRIPPLY